MNRDNRKENSRKENSRQRNRVPFVVLSVALVVVLAVVAGIAVKNNDNSEKTVNTDSQGNVSGNVEKWQEGVIKHNGRYFKYNNHIKTYLLMGIDKEKSGETEVGDGGQSDAMFLLVTNESDKTLSVISIHRNAMTDVDVYGDSGTILKTVEAQICTQYAFGDGKHLSCSRAVDAVSRLFYNVPITEYLAMQMGAIPVMNDAVGGVEVEVLRDLSDEGKGVDLKEGETVTLTGDEAYVYLRSRDTDEYDSATNRLRRQEQYITCFAEQMQELTSGSKSKALEIYESIEDYIVTNIDFADFVLKLEDYEYDESRMYTVPGETRMGEKLEEYHVDDEALYDMIIDIFYEEVQS